MASATGSSAVSRSSAASERGSDRSDLRLQAPHRAFRRESGRSTGRSRLLARVHTQLDVEALAIRTNVRGTIAGPPPGAGLAYHAQEIKGRAGFIVS